ncbi:MAG: carboxypeptidase regulatory-like domain-containing protein [Candidatus Methanoperedens sp.]|nr:carboxypeptidase regulatory-like domain-containing protein [Candidatus Methanoperedens sp.]
MSARPAYGRWNGTTWVYDSETSPAIGVGDPASDNSRSPWGGRIEMGAYGNTPYASRPKPPEILGFINDRKNETPLAGSTVTLYHSNGTSTGSLSTSGADGRFQFSNIPSGVYYVNVTKDGFFSNRSLMFTVAANSTVNAGNVTLVNRDVNGDGDINVLDLTEIIRRYLDLNNDGKVDAADLFMVSGYFNPLI